MNEEGILQYPIYKIKEDIPNFIYDYREIMLLSYTMKLEERE